jgi:hypothetical protein
MGIDTSAFPVAEFETGFSLSTGAPEWNGKIGVDLRWVATVAPYSDGAVALSMCGAATSFVVRGDYDEVMRLWLRAKDIVPGTAARADGEGGHV